MLTSSEINRIADAVIRRMESKRATQLVSMSKAVKETGKSKTWITEYRKINPSVAVKTTGRNYKYDLVALKNVA